MVKKPWPLESESLTKVIKKHGPMETYYFDETDPAEELDVNTGDITSEETDEAIKCLRSKKAPGLDGIQAELLKEGGRTMIEVLTKLFNRCWNQEEVPEDWKKGVIVRLPKKGNLSECGNWRGTLLSVPGKTFCLILLRRLQNAINKCLREEQAGSRSGRSCTEQIFTLRNIVEQCMEYHHPLFVNFIDFKKAFDSIHRDSLWKILRIYGIPSRFISIFKILYLNSSCCVRTNNGHTHFFEITTAVRQGCILSPFLFNICLDFVMRRAMRQTETGLSWYNEERLADSDFADDIALLAQDEGKL
ncbi:hypothetical protein TELCIR_10574 [Teladorsagia circumcincta]|uniref:Reverse transcriptase domain-containing protein n=1 Tax=Teladorsagia circumcincta TaxID=45464 RepID=A0A2G9UBP9_TELCI|nr:hypothetical protein TELCIR_10574 [Teladorsagia circumcincta]